MRSVTRIVATVVIGALLGVAPAGAQAPPKVTLIQTFPSMALVGRNPSARLLAFCIRSMNATSSIVPARMLTVTRGTIAE